MNKPIQPGPSSTVTCLLPEAEQRGRRETVLHDILAAALEIGELEDGILLRFPGTDAWFRKLADFVSFERACCPFLAFEVTPEPDFGTITLTVRGRATATDFLNNAFGKLKASVAASKG